ncbi:YdcF family protein [Christensenellaceae bacterium OttesenSCG-928-K19]|nr:YdcF family protein [Christensenellaceae bacterium OttesenSCG-928-K19]
MKRFNKQKLARILFIVAGVLLIADTVFVRTRSNWNLGVLLPTLLGAPLLLYGIFKPRLDIWFRRGIGKVVKWVFICGYVFMIALTVTMSALMLSAANTTPQPGAQAVIVLGAGIKGDQVSWTLQNRLDKAAGYYEQNPNALIVLSGGYGKGKNISEAQAMEKYMLGIGIPASAMIKEERSTSTNENFRFSKELLDERFGNSYHTVYVTNDFHILRAGINAKDEGLTAEGLSAPTPIYIAFNNYLRESLALLATFTFGTQISSV